MAMYAQNMQTLDGILFRCRYNDVPRIRAEASDIFSKPQAASLTPQYNAFVKPGSSGGPHLLCLQGTIPIYYSNTQYNIPVVIWITEGYPYQPPVVLVTPTSDMIIAPRHRHVDAAGTVYHPYISSWNPSTSSILGLIHLLSGVFSSEPPVRSQPSSHRQPVTPTPQPPTPPTAKVLPPPPYTPSSYTPQGSGTITPSGAAALPPGGSISANPYAAYLPSSTATITPSSLPPPYSSSTSRPSSYTPPPEYVVPRTEDPQEVLRRNATNAVTDKIKKSLKEFQETTAKQIENLMVENTNYEQGASTLERERENIQKQIEQLEQQIKSTATKNQEIEKWLETNEKTPDEIDIDSATDPKDTLSKQLLYLVAEDAMIEDLLYYLDRALNSDRITLDAYLKSVRTLCRDQFMTRATTKKVQEAQRSRTLGR